MQLRILLIAIAVLLSEVVLSLDLLSNQPPTIYRNGPGKCSSNLVKCRKFAKLDWCIHLCLYMFEGYIMLNASFSIWAVTTDPLSYELGPIEDNIESQNNPPTMTGKWQFFNGNDFIGDIAIQHWRYSSVENVHFFRLQNEYETEANYSYSGNIMEFDENSNRFKLFLYEEKDEVRTKNSLIGYMDADGASIQWTALDISENPIDKSNILFADTEFRWPPRELPRSRGCINYGPLEKHKSLEKVCGLKPKFGEYDGEKFTFTPNQTKELDRQLIEGESGCPVCDYKEQWTAYWACKKRFEIMETELESCHLLMGSTMLDELKWICSKRLQLCVKFRSATFSASKIELCPEPSIRIINDNDNREFEGINEATFPDANPVIFGCIDFPITSGLLGQMNERTKTKFIVAGKRAKVAWYVQYWEYTKIALFTLGAILFLRWLLKRPSSDDREDNNYEEFDDAKFFEEYGEFYSDDTQDESEEDLYDEMF